MKAWSLYGAAFQTAVLGILTELMNYENRNRASDFDPPDIHRRALNDLPEACRTVIDDTD